MKRIFSRIIWTRWKVARTIWPYREGYGTYRMHRFTRDKTILDTGLTKEQAIESAKELNFRK